MGCAQLVAWASSTYLPAIIARPLAGELGIAVTLVYAAVSVSLLLMAAVAPAVGRLIDRRGGRFALCLGNLLLAAGLLILAATASSAMLFIGWAVLGLGMALGLYDAAFSALVRLYGSAARGPITGVTLIGGFASTLGWPLSSWLLALGDWRLVCLVWAAVHLLLILPLHWFGIPEEAPAAAPPPALANEARAAIPAGGRRDFMLLALFAALTAFVTSAMAAHLPALLLASGASAGLALLAAALLGPAQVLARLGEFFTARHWQIPVLSSARLASSLHPLGALGLLCLGGVPWAVIGFAVLHGAGNGMITIAKGTLPLVLFGTRGYGERQGLLAMLQRCMQAGAPVFFAWLLEHFGASQALLLSFGLSLAALACLLGLRRPPAAS